MISLFRKHFELAHGGHKSILPMEGMRGLAVFLVFLAHYASFIHPWLLPGSSSAKFASVAHAIGQSGVDLFFVLSGYLIYGMLIKRKRPFVPYFRGRIRRIYPTFLVVLLIYLVLSVVFPAESKLPSGTGAKTLFILQNLLLLPGLFDITAIITVAWSLSYEAFYYLLVPALILALNLRAWRPNQRLVLFAIVTVVGFALSALFGGHLRLLMFVAGILLYDIKVGGFLRRVPPLGIPALLMAVFATPLLMDWLGWPFWVGYAVMFVAFLYFCLDCFLVEGRSARSFTFAPLRWLGNMSYSYYLIHGLALKFSFLVLGKVYPPSGDEVWIWWVLFLPAFVVTLVPSALLFLGVEKPLSLKR